MILGFKIFSSVNWPVDEMQGSWPVPSSVTRKILHSLPVLCMRCLLIHSVNSVTLLRFSFHELEICVLSLSLSIQISGLCWSGPLQPALLVVCFIYIYIYIYICICMYVKQSRYRPGVAQRVPGS